MTILVFCPNLVGDTAMATPAFRALRLGYPAARIVAVIKPKIAAVLDGGPWFDDRIGFDPRSQRAEERSLAKRYTGELNAQEDTLGTLRRELAGLEEQRTAAQAELSRRIELLQIAGVEQGAAK